MASSLPVAGRVAEADALVAAYTAAAGGQSRVMLLTGDAGIGKTRLVEEVRDRVLSADPRAQMRTGESAPLAGAALAFGPFVAALGAERAREHRTDSRATWRAVAQAWQDAGQPYREAYARLREAEAAARAGRRDHAARALAPCSSANARSPYVSGLAGMDYAGRAGPGRAGPGQQKAERRCCPASRWRGG